MTDRETGSLLILIMLTLTCLGVSVVGWAYGISWAGIVCGVATLYGVAMIWRARRQIAKYRGAEVEGIELRKKVGEEYATGEIVACIEEHPHYDAYDIAEWLRLPLTQVERITQHLCAEGVLRPATEVEAAVGELQRVGDEAERANDEDEGPQWPCGGYL